MNKLRAVLSTMLAPLASPVTLGEAVAEHLRTAIVAGELPPGVHLREVELAARIGVSATPVREALAQLQAEGLVEIEPNRLKRVAPLDSAKTLNLFRVQAALWRLGYVWSFDRIGEAEVGKLEQSLIHYSTALERGDPLGAIRAGHAFHTVFVQASGNEELLRVTLDRLSLIARFILLRGSSTVSLAGLKQHRMMLKALKRGESDEVLRGLDQLAQKLIALASTQAGMRQAQS
jgi:DNA-binding GntR family transcriptional regulator